MSCPCNPADHVGVKELADRYGVKPDTVEKWRLRHIDTPPPVGRLSGVYWWHADDWDEWARAHKKL